MACATIKRHLEFDPMYNSQGGPCKRPRYSSSNGHQNVQASMSLGSDVLCTPQRTSPQQSIDSSSPFAEVATKLTPEKMAANIKEEVHRLSRKKQLRYSDEITPHRAAATANNPTMMVTTVSSESDQKPLFTYTDVSVICERMLREQEQRIREEYDKILSDKLAEQYDTFVKFTHDQIQKKFNSNNHPSYLS